MPNWPQWYPKLELSAEHLRGLEDFLLEPGRIDSNGFGVAVWSSESVSLEQSNSGDRLVVNSVRGITPGGQPVRVETGPPLTLPLPEEHKTFDLWVVVGPEVSDTEAENIDNKQVLTLTAASHGAGIADQPSWLYLGSYSNENSLVLQTPPMPLFLGALYVAEIDRSKALSSWDWETWTAPLSRRLGECFGRVASLGMSSPGMVAAAHELLLIAVDWPQIPIVRLASRLARVKRIADWILSDSEEETLPSAPTARFDWCAWQRDTVAVASLPQDLADLLGDDLASVVTSPKDRVPKAGSVVLAERRGKEFRVVKQVGGTGDDDSLYRVQADGELFELKWCAPGSASRANLDHLLDVGSPSKSFLWPIDLASSSVIEGFGFLRAIPGEKMRCLGGLLAQGVQMRLRIAVWAGINLAAALVRLNQRQLNFLNPTLDDLLLDTESGDLQILYSDNVGSIDAPFNRNRIHAILAPDVRSGYALPSSESDEYILRALLYCLLLGRIPTFLYDDGILDFALGGQDVHAPINSLYESVGTTSKKGNIPGARRATLDHWQLFPPNLQRAFGNIQSTMHGHDVGRSESITSWIRMLSDFFDHVFECSHCGQSAVYCDEKLVDKPSRCIYCDQPLVFPPRLRIEGHVVVLGPSRQLFSHHVAPGNDLDFSSPVAEVVEHPSMHGDWGLLNLTTEEWDMCVGSKRRAIRPKRAAMLDVDMTIDFDGITGEIRSAGSLTRDDTTW